MVITGLKGQLALGNKQKPHPPFLLETLASAAEWMLGKHISTPALGASTAPGDLCQCGSQAWGPYSESGPSRW